MILFEIYDYGEIKILLHMCANRKLKQCIETKILPKDSAMTLFQKLRYFRLKFLKNSLNLKKRKDYLMLTLTLTTKQHI